MTLADQLIKHEGLRLKVYRCPAGKLTIGVGRNLEDNGISEQEARMLLQNDISRISAALHTELPWTAAIPRTLFEVLVNMAFNLGMAGLLKFERFLAALQDKDYQTAADEMLESRWAHQVGARATELAEIVRRGG